MLAARRLATERLARPALTTAGVATFAAGAGALVPPPLT
jgi:hypothetical protein